MCNLCCCQLLLRNLVVVLRLPFGEQAFADVQPRFKEDEHRHGKQGLRDGVRRGEQHADGKCGKDDIGAFFGKGFRADDAEHDEDDGRDRHFKRRAEGDEHRQAEVHVLGDVRLVFDALEFNPGEETEEYRQDDEVGKQHAGVKKDGGGDEDGAHQPLFMAVHPRRDERPHLVENPRDSEEAGEEQADFDRGEENVDAVVGEHGLAGQHIVQNRQGESLIDAVAERQQQQKNAAEGVDDAQQAGAQLDEVLNDGHFRVVVFRSVGGVGHGDCRMDGFQGAFTYTIAGKVYVNDLCATRSASRYFTGRRWGLPHRSNRPGGSRPALRGCLQFGG